MKSFAFLIAGLSISFSSFAGYQGLPQYIANHYSQGTDTGSLEAALAACRNDIAKQKSVVTSKGYSVIEESDFTPHRALFWAKDIKI